MIEETGGGISALTGLREGFGGGGGLVRLTEPIIDRFRLLDGVLESRCVAKRGRVRARTIRRRLRADLTGELVFEVELGDVRFAVVRELVEPLLGFRALEADSVGLDGLGADLVGLVLEVFLHLEADVFVEVLGDRRIFDGVRQVLVGLTNAVEGRDLPVRALELRHFLHAIRRL